MIAIPLGATRVDEALRVVKALGSHRYVAGRLHLVHAFVFAALSGDVPGLAEGCAWARETLARGDVDPASRDEALWRRSTEAEVVAVLAEFWNPGDAGAAARGALEELLRRHELPLPTHAPFDEAAEDAMHPLLIDAGWELLPLAELDPQRHRGAMDAYGHALAFESARFEEETAIPPPRHLYELPAFGPAELLRGADAEGALAAELVVWADGDETYLDYVVRGVRRAAKLPERDEDD
jgi:hypothetical protein